MRTDISKYLIHFLRKPSNLDLPKGENKNFTKAYYPLRVDSEINSEFECLTNIIKEGGLRASFSYRNGKQTIYGKYPVVCFTEMPLINFLQYAKSRTDTRITNYGLAFLKNDIFEYGGRPVISGLSYDNTFNFEDISNRILDPKILGYSEQYRYVKLDLRKRNDWTHEREWRIKFKTSNFSIRDELNNNYIFIKALPISHFDEIIIILQSEKEAIEIQPIVQDQLDSGYCRSGQEFCEKVKYLILDNAIEYLNENSVTSIENLPDTVYYEHVYETLSDQEKKKIYLTIEKCKKLAPKFANEFHKKTKLSKHPDDNHYIDVGGWANIRTDNTQNKYVRYLIKKDIASIFSDGFIWLKDMDIKVPVIQSLTYYDYIAGKQIEILNQELNLNFYLDSRID
tara:strand:- start:71 stop:1261 length:1191 start_codon:yes stop_codon:yes gene_type:complete